MRDCRCGSIWLVNFEPSVDTEIEKTRPALIISPTDFNQVRAKVSLLPISSTVIRNEKIAPVVVRAIATLENGLNHESTIIAIEPSTFDKRRLIKYLGQLESSYFQKIKSILKFYLDV